MVKASFLLPVYVFFTFCATAQKARFEFYTKADGLVNNLTTQVVQDDQGFIWLLNAEKLLRFDGRKFINYPLPEALTEGNAFFGGLAAFQDSLLFISTSNGGFLLNPKNNQSNLFLIPEFNGTAYSLEPLHILDGGGDMLLLGYPKDDIHKKTIWRLQDRQLRRIELPAEITVSETSYPVISDAFGNTYLIKPGTLHVFDASGKQHQEIPVPSSFNGNGTTSWANFDQNGALICLADLRFFILDKGGPQFRPHPVNRFLTDIQLGLTRFSIKPNGDIWACGSDRNLIHYDAALDTMFNFHSDMIALIPHGCLFNNILKDNTGTVWVCTQLGLVKVVPQEGAFDNYFTGLSKEMAHYSFRGLAEDGKGMIYGSYYIGMAKIDLSNHREYTDVLPIKAPFGLYASGDSLWLNTGRLWHTSAQKFIAVSGAAPHLNPPDWGVLTKDKKGRIWHMYGLELSRLSADSAGLKWELVTHIPGTNATADAIHAGQHSGLIWIGCIEQLFAWSPESQTLRRFGAKELGFPVSRIMTIEEDRDGNLWLGTDIGLLYFSPSTGEVRRYSVNDGLPDNYICGMLSEGDSCLWLSTNNGLSRFHIGEETFVNFSKEDGLTDNEFNRVSYLKSRDGRMYFGGLSGVNAFFPHEIMKYYTRKNEAAHLVLSAFERTDEERDTIIRESYFARYPEIHLQYWDRSFTFEYALTDYSNPSGIHYSYRMEGYEDTWSPPSKFNFTRFSSLPSGTYVFRVKARDNHGLWHPNELAVKVVVHPPFWATWWAYAFYLLLVLGIAYSIYSFLKKRLLLQNQLKLEHEESIRLKELDGFKSRLYTNLTHEFRTPLTVILGMVGQIRDRPKEYLEEGTQLIETNGKNLLHLINQLLDLSKLENKSFELHPQQSDIIPYLRYITESFQTYANGKNLSLRFFSLWESFVMDYDPEQLKQILTNLVSNAIKFTPSGGEVSIRVSLNGAPHAQNAEPELLKKQWLNIEVRDTGIGIAAKDISHVFDRFYQVDGSHTREGEGTGIGLAHTEELVNLMGGEVGVESELGNGSRFWVRLPVTNNAAWSERAAYTPPVTGPIHQSAVPESPLRQSPTTLPQLLIIEDNPDVVIYLKSCLEGLYQIDIAYNGKIGIEKALENIPDIIVSDVMMPEKDGYQVCDTLKNDERTSHIPIILLTAKADAASKLAGLRRGADAYLTKPFDKEEMLIRLEKLVERQKRMKAYFSQNLLAGISTNTAKAEPEEAIQIENAFLQKVLQIVEEHYSDETFALPELCQKVGMSRSQLFRKMQAVSNTSPSDFIRSYRLNKAETLLENTELNISEVAWQVGYKDVSHFSRSYRETFGIWPSAKRK